MEKLERKFKYAVGIILYNPMKNEINNVSNYCEVFDKVYIYDNSRENNELDIELALGGKNYEYFYNGENEGISIPFNIMLTKASNAHYKYFLMMDQDSIFTKENIEITINQIEKNPADNVAIYCPNILFNESKKTEISKDSYVEFCITSGSFVDIDKYLRLGGYDEKLFIDGIDRDYCIRVIEKKYKIKKISSSVMKQSLGSKDKNLLGVFEHSDIRNYYIFRNRLYVINKYPNKFEYFNKFKYLYLSQLKQILSIILFERHKKDKLLYIKRAKIDYKCDKFGRYSEE